MTEEEKNKMIQDKMQELMKPVTEAMMACKSTEEVLMLSSIMISTSKEVFVNILGEKEAKEVFEEILTK